jgi:GTP-binding protein YchF
MEITIIGYPKTGKTTVFNALTQGRAETTSYTTGTLKPNIGVAKVPDPRLGVLAEMYHPERVVFAEVQYADIPGMPEGFGASVGIHGELLNLLQRADALVHVVRDFSDPGIPTAKGGESPEVAIPGMELELTVVDLGILERRMERLRATEKGAKTQERAALQREQALLTRLTEALEQSLPVRDQELSQEERKLVANYQLLTAKPVLVVLNLGEEMAQDLTTREQEFRDRFDRPGVGAAALCGKLEMELAELADDERQEFRTSLGLAEPGRDRVIQASYRLLDLVSFLTSGPDEVRAWSVFKDTPAMESAGRIHSDIARGFIRAEVVSFNDLVACGSTAEARKRGLLRQEGKTYPMQDGDVVNFLFNV